VKNRIIIIIFRLRTHLHELSQAANWSLSWKYDGSPPGLWPSADLIRLFICMSYRLLLYIYGASVEARIRLRGHYYRFLLFPVETCAQRVILEAILLVRTYLDRAAREVSKSNALAERAEAPRVEVDCVSNLHYIRQQQRGLHHILS
jgi:hypothetical protein